MKLLGRKVDRINRMDRMKEKAFSIVYPPVLLNLANPVNPV
jgi:hypothetical protein